MMVDQEQVRNRYIKYLNETGIKQKIICIKLGLNESMISRFRNNKANLQNYDLCLLDEYISKVGF